MTSIFKAIRNNDIQLLNYFIQHATGDHGTIPKQDLQFIQHHHHHKLNTPSKHFDLNKRSVHGRTPLHLAVTWNRVQIAHDLIHCSSVNINLRDRENGWTALHRLDNEHYIIHLFLILIFFSPLEHCIWEISRLQGCYYQEKTLI